MAYDIENHYSAPNHPLENHVWPDIERSPSQDKAPQGLEPHRSALNHQNRQNGIGRGK